MKAIEATILVEPTPKGRPRLRVMPGTAGGKSHATAYTPAKTRKSEAQIVADVRREITVQGMFSRGVAINVSAVFFRTKPKSAKKSAVYPTQKPDVDNYGKLLLDALNKFAYAEDAQITTLLVAKRYALPGETPRIVLRIREEDVNALGQ